MSYIKVKIYSRYGIRIVSMIMIMVKVVISMMCILAIVGFRSLLILCTAAVHQPTQTPVTQIPLLTTPSLPNTYNKQQYTP